MTTRSLGRTPPGHQRHSPQPAADGGSPATRSRAGLFGLRARLVAWFGFVLLMALVASLLAADWVLLSRLDARIDAALAQEVEELRALAEDLDPATG